MAFWEVNSMKQTFICTECDYPCELTMHLTYNFGKEEICDLGCPIIGEANWRVLTKSEGAE